MPALNSLWLRQSESQYLDTDPETHPNIHAQEQGWGQAPSEV